MSTTTDNAEQSNVTGKSEVGQVVILGETVKSGVNSMQKDSLNGANMTDLEAFFRREVKVTSFTIAGTDSMNPFTSKLSLFCPFKELKLNAAVFARMKGYRYYKADCVIRFTVDAPANAYGCYVFSAMPVGYHDQMIPANILNESNNGYQCTQCDIHGVMNIGLGNSVELKLPFFHNREWAKVSPMAVSGEEYPHMWLVDCYCWHPLSNATATDAISLTVTAWAHFENVQFMSPRVEGKRSFPSKGDKWLSTNLGIAAGAMGGMSEVPVIGAYATPAAAGLSVAATLADMMGFTRKQKTEDPMPVMQRLFSGLTTVAGNDTSENLALYPGTTSSIDPSLVAPVTEDQMSLDYLLQKWTVVAQVIWTAGTAVGTRLLGLPVTPGLCLQSSSYLLPTVPGFIGCPFTYWSGGMEYMFYIPVSSFHKGRLQILWADDLISSFSVDPTNQLYNVLMDVTATNRLCVKVGWQSDRPALRMRMATTAPIKEFRNGNLHIFVSSPLIAPDPNTTTTITVLARACPDMRFAMPKAVEPSLAAGDADDFLTSFHLEGGVVGESSEEIDCIDLVPSSCKAFGVMAGTVETFESVRPLLQKFTQYYRTKLSTAPHLYQFPLRAAPPINHAALEVDPNATFMIPAAPIWTNNSGIALGSGDRWVPHFTWYGWYTSMYAGVTGGGRMKIHAATLNQSDVAAAERPITVIATLINDNQILNEIADAARTVGDASSAGSANSAWQVIKDTNGAEFNFPSYCLDRLFEPRGLMPNMSNATGLFIRDVEKIQIGFPYAHTLPSGNDYVLNFFYAGSSDACGVMFKKVPRVIYRRDEAPTIEGL
jgi:hypothetical protein